VETAPAIVAVLCSWIPPWQKWLESVWQTLRFLWRVPGRSQRRHGKESFFSKLVLAISSRAFRRPNGCPSSGPFRNFEAFPSERVGFRTQFLSQGRKGSCFPEPAVMIQIVVQSSSWIAFFDSSMVRALP